MCFSAVQTINNQIWIECATEIRFGLPVWTKLSSDSVTELHMASAITQYPQRKSDLWFSALSTHSFIELFVYWLLLLWGNRALQNRDGRNVSSTGRWSSHNTAIYFFILKKKKNYILLTMIEENIFSQNASRS